MITLGRDNANPLLEEVNERSGENVLNCYQCGKCVGTCPVADYMDFPPREIMQLIKIGRKEAIYAANSTWYCLTCSACSGRCPREIDIPRVMETLRHMSIEENYKPGSKRVKDIRRFHEIFIDMVKKYGRNYELRLMAEFNIRTRNLFQNMQLAPKALLKGKIKVLPGSRVKSAKAIKRMYDVAEKLEKSK